MIVILSGPSGVGKDTVLDAWTRVNPLVERVVAATTRKPRPGEVDGVDYHFLSEREFDQMVEEDAFVEHMTVHGKKYGTPMAGLADVTARGKTAVLKIDVQGAAEAMRKYPDAVSVFLLPPSWEELEARIRRRATDAEEAIRERLANARAELDTAGEYAHQVVNKDVDQTVKEIEEIISA